LTLVLLNCGGGGDAGSEGGGGTITSCIIPGTPTINSVSGKISNGELISIAGSGFGSCGPNVVIYDDFEKGISGNSISTDVGSAQVGHWDAIGANFAGIRYSNAYRHSGSISYMDDWSSNNGAEGHRYLEINSLSGTSAIYFSWWSYIPTGVNVPGAEQGAADPGGGPNWKIFWLYGLPFPQNDITSTFTTNSLPSSGAWFIGAGNDISTARYDSGWGFDPSFIKGQWTRWEVYILGSTSNGIVQFFETNATHARYAVVNATGVVTMHPGAAWNILHFPGYGRGDPNAQTYHDDIYVAKGAGALARVELGNHPAYTSCTNLSVITPTSWNNNSITATVRQGSFSDLENVYLFVVDAAGTVSPGYPVTIGNAY